MFAIFTPLESAAESAERLKEGLRETPHNLQEVLKQVVDRFFQHLPGVLTGIVIFLFFWLLARLASRLVRKLAERARSDEALRDLLVPLTRFAVLAVGVLMALDQMGFEVSSLLAGVGIAGLAAVERNRVLVPRARQASVIVERGDALEIVHLVGGG